MEKYKVVGVPDDYSSTFRYSFPHCFRSWENDFTPEARAMESPFVLCGACIVFACAFAGNRVLNKWVQTIASPNPYLSATGITLLLFLLANVAHFLRPAAYDNSFRAYGLPFHFYREGGFVDGWVWRRGGFIWHGIVADTALMVGIVVLLGKGVAKDKQRPSAIVGKNRHYTHSVFAKDQSSRFLNISSGPSSWLGEPGQYRAQPEDSGYCECAAQQKGCPTSRASRDA